ncbi:adenine phosphoribosyltransferase [Metamycoplasma hyosynoviae]|uniref:Adenine phosphoribosyltransferase n=1 Tax=Metamycoplasma hyosynoviae TaxID=29559 RepID=A0A9Q9F2H5_9BACT|nr:adenine phosphoribosyltransferase [Metamycoplasma hyosynoviae]MDC8917861.1 adenine phosphoribosyltransferase [Metamycoplasma hyosynoviae]MDC8919485.1 adenine phosphoribosyltransferase [Metamycoplasma hyosynoviae]MDC8921891.1 adenine phosphoribosyltransferase [Metamycoplasma hyosynoviae]MDC8962731.1 adenine phosphoribosyltransferase [Metamycoplasma hyosynoviae]MDD1360652.1 adenine phosphoribosyltransferase [Metamycoplasma hyosynoviae]
MDLKKYIRTVKDFPKPGISFKDISLLLANGEALHYTIEKMADLAKDADIIVGPDARGFLFGTPVAAKLKKPFIMVRKKGKLPGDVVSCDYGLEYGRNVLELQKGVTKPGQKAVIIDDVLATGGTLEAIIKLLESEKVEVSKIIVLMELEGFDARKRLKCDVENLIFIGENEQ